MKTQKIHFQETIIVELKGMRAKKVLVDIEKQLIENGMGVYEVHGFLGNRSRYKWVATSITIAEKCQKKFDKNMTAKIKRYIAKNFDILSRDTISMLYPYYKKQTRGYVIENEVFFDGKQEIEIFFKEDFMEFADQFSKKFKMLSPGYHYSDNKAYTIKYHDIFSLNTFFRVGHESKDILANRQMIVHNKSINSNGVYYMILWCHARVKYMQFGIDDYGVVDRAVMDQYKRENRPVKDVYNCLCSQFEACDDKRIKQHMKKRIDSLFCSYKFYTTPSLVKRNVKKKPAVLPDIRKKQTKITHQKA